jgi:hypothetical protein
MRTKEFEEYSHNKADFSIIPGTVPLNSSHSNNSSSMSVIPISDPEANQTSENIGNTRAKFNVAEYIHML